MAKTTVKRIWKMWLGNWSNLVKCQSESEVTVDFKMVLLLCIVCILFILVLLSWTFVASFGVLIRNHSCEIVIMELTAFPKHLRNTILREEKFENFSLPAISKWQNLYIRWWQCWSWYQEKSEVGLFSVAKDKHSCASGSNRFWTDKHWNFYICKFGWWAFSEKF